MAGRNYSSTISKFTPFSSGIQDYRLGFAENAVLFQIKDENLGEQTYFSLRPSMAFQTEGTLGSYISAVDHVVATTKGLAYTQGTSVVDLLSGTKITDYQSIFNSTGSANTTKTQLFLHEYTGTTAGRFAVLAGNDPTITTGVTTKIFITDIAATPAAGSAVEFVPSFSACPYGVSMDGYLFFAEKDSDTIYNSDLNDYTAWDLSTQLVRATQFPGNIVALSRINNYVVAFKENSLEFFYNAGLSDTSPLQRNTSYTKQIGLYNTGSLVSNNNTCYFIGKDQYGSRKVYELTETKCDVISTVLVDEYLGGMSIYKYSTSVNAFFWSTSGKRFYVLQDLNQSFSLVYDINEKVWYKWYSNEAQLPLRYCKSTSDSFFDTYYGVGTSLVGEIGGSCGLWFSTFGANGGTSDYLPDVENASIENARIVLSLYLPPTDFGTVNRKFCRELSISGFWPGTLPHSYFTHTLTMSKYAGGKNETIVRYGNNRNNMNYKNWGQFINMAVKYSCSDALVDNSETGRAGDVRLYGINYDVSTGVS